MFLRQLTEGRRENISLRELIYVNIAKHITLRATRATGRKKTGVKRLSHGIRKQKKIIKIMWEKIMTCSECQWYVEENTRSGRYEHEEALRQGRGFCLIQDLFTDKELFDEACEDFKSDGK